MKPSSFQTTIENQFDYICKRAMEDERKNYMLYLSRIAKREVSFSDVGDYLVSQFATTDNYSTDFQIFTLNGLSPKKLTRCCGCTRNVKFYCCFTLWT